MKTSIKILVILLLPFCFLSTPLYSKGDGDKKNEKAEEKEEEKNEGKTDGKNVEDSIYRSYLNVGSLTIPVIKNDRVYGYIKLKAQIMTKDGSTIEPFRPYKKRLIDAYFTDVYTVMSDRWLPPKEPTSEAIQKRLSKQTDRIVGSDKLLTILPTFYFYKNPEKQEKQATHKK